MKSTRVKNYDESFLENYHIIGKRVYLDKDIINLDVYVTKMEMRRCGLIHGFQWLKIFDKAAMHHYLVLTLSDGY